MGELTDQKISRWVRACSSIFKAWSWNTITGQQLQKNRKYDLAVEKYVDAVYDEKIKRHFNACVSECLKIH